MNALATLQDFDGGRTPPGTYVFHYQPLWPTLSLLGSLAFTLLCGGMAAVFLVPPASLSLAIPCGLVGLVALFFTQAPLRGLLSRGKNVLLITEEGVTRRLGGRVEGWAFSEHPSVKAHVRGLRWEVALTDSQRREVWVVEDRSFGRGEAIFQAIRARLPE